jgi:hypothetical protein
MGGPSYNPHEWKVFTPTLSFAGYVRRNERLREGKEPMDKIRIAVRIPLAVAVSQCKASYGDDFVELTDSDLAGMSDAAREVVANAQQDRSSYGRVALYLSGSTARPLHVTDLNVTSTLAAIEAMAAARVLEIEKAKAEIEARIEASLAAPLEDWIHPGFSGPCGSEPSLLQSPGRCYLNNDDCRDPRIVARLEQVTSEALPVRIAEWRKANEEEAAARKVKETEAQARAEAFKAACSRYVIELVPEYTRAAREGHNVNSVAKKDAVAQLHRRLVNGGKYVGDDGELHGLLLVDSYTAPKEHDRPSQTAYYVFDAVVATVSDSPFAADFVKGIATRIVRIDTCEVSDCTAGLRTAIEASLYFNDGTEEKIYVYADSASLHTHEGEVDDE